MADPSSSSTGVLNIVILGASFAGLAVAHKFLRKTIEEICVVRTTYRYRVIVVGPSTHLYWNIAAPRALTSEKALSLDKVFVPFVDLFDEYPRKRVSFIQGLAVDVDFDARKVTIDVTGDAIAGIGISTNARWSHGTAKTTNPTLYKQQPAEEKPRNLQQIPFHALVIATGTSAESPLLSLHGDHSKTIKAIQQFRDRVARASSIVVAGGGPSGIECSGQLATIINGGRKRNIPSRPISGSEYDDSAQEKHGKRNKWLHRRLGRRSNGTNRHGSSSNSSNGAAAQATRTKIPITLISGHDRLLPRLDPKFGAQAEEKLKSLGVNILHNTRVNRAVELPSGTTRCYISDADATAADQSSGDALDCGVFVAATGVFPNTSFLHAELLDKSGYVNTDAFLRVLGAGERVYAVGDCASHTKNSIQDVYDSLPVLLHNVRNDCVAWEMHTQFPHGGAEARLERLELEDWAYVQNPTDSQLMPITRFGGVGILFGVKLPSLLVWLMKGRDYRVGRAEASAGVGKDPYAVV